MLNEVAKKWVAALRSGKYKQGREFLRDRDDRYCCLGVLCEIAVSDGVISPAGLDGECYSYAAFESFLPIKVSEWAGVNNASMCVLWNDKHNKTFAEIADLIESEPEGLFVQKSA